MCWPSQLTRYSEGFDMMIIPNSTAEPGGTPATHTAHQYGVEVVGRGWILYTGAITVVDPKKNVPTIYENSADAWSLARKTMDLYKVLGVTDADVVVRKRTVATVFSAWTIA
jgi:hypothetical protein